LQKPTAARSIAASSAPWKIRLSIARVGTSSSAIARRPIFDSGLLAVIEGDTTIEEVVRCIRSEA
jgi:hypothetical protein